MKQTFRLTALALVLSLVAGWLPAGWSNVAEAAVWRTYYVSPNGNDSWSGMLAAPNAGGTDGPFKTIQKARDVVRSVKSGASGDIEVVLRGGTYPITSAIVFNETDSGKSATERIIYKAYPGETPVISGGQQVTGTWSAVSGKPYSKITLPSTVTDFRNFYVNGERRPRAQTELAIAGKGWYNVSATSETKDGFIIDGSMLPALTDASRAEIHQQVSWRDNRLPIKEIQTLASGDKAIVMDQPYFSEALNNPPFGTTPSFNRIFFVENDLSLLDKPGEWYFNPGTKELFYYPKAGESLSSITAYYPVAKTLLDIKGSSLTNKVRYLTFQGISFKHNAWNEPSSQGMFGNQAEWIFKPDGPANTSLAEHPPGAVQVDAAEYIDFKDNDFRNLGSIGLAILYANRVNVIGNVFYDISEAGITIGTQAGAVIDQSWEETPKFNTVQNNVIRYIGQEYMGAPAIQPYFTQDTNISYNDIAEVPYCGISANSWTPNDSLNPTRRVTINNNRVVNYMKVTRDCGGIYTWATMGDSTASNRSMIKNNYVKKGYGDYGGLYLDETSKYIDVSNNAVEDPHPNWLYLWKDTIKYVSVTNNYATTQTWINRATDSTVDQAILYSASNPPSAVQSIIAGAGLQSGYTGLLSKVPTRPSNGAPSVNAGSDATATLTSTIGLSPTVSDDGLPSGIYLKSTWSKVSGPGTVTFGNANVAATTAAFSAAGTYVLRLTVSDGDLSASDDVSVTVSNATLPANIALNKTATATSTYDSNYYPASKAVDGDINTGWASLYQDGVVDEHITVDLGSAQPISRIEVVMRQDSCCSSWTGPRTNFAVMASNDSNFSDFSTVKAFGGVGDEPVEEKGVWVVNSTDTTAYRYVRLAKVPYADMFVSEIRVFSSSGGTSSDIALNKTAVTSSNESASHTGALAVDGNSGTRWASQSTDPSWIYVDLGASYNINRVKLNWEVAYGKSYKIQVSNDASAWTDVYSTTTGDGGIDDLTGLSGTGRYVRMYGTQRGTTYGYSLWDFEVYGTPASSNTTNRALNRTVVTSGNESAAYDGSRAVDGNGGTRWASQSVDPSWLYVDLGASYSISRVKLSWEAAYGKSYKIQVSNDASTWTDVYSTTTGDGGVDDLTGLSGTGRYVRMYGTQRGTTWGYSLWEFEVY